MLRKNSSARVRVIVCERVAHVLNGEVVVAKLLRIDKGFVLLDIATGGVDLGYPGNRTKQRPDDPVLYGTALDQLFFGQRPLSVILALEGVLIHFAERVCDGTQHGCNALGHAVAELAKPFGDHLALKIKAAPVFKDQRNERKPGLVQRAHIGHAGETGHRDLDRNGDETFNLFGGFSGSLGGDLDLDIRDVGESVDGQLLCSVDPETYQGDRDDDENEAMLQRTVNDGLQHCYWPPLIAFCLR